MQPFHLALPVHDLEAARGFYQGLLGCPPGRVDTRWVDFNFFGHQLSNGYENRLGGGRERRLMDLVPAPAVRLMKSRV